MVRCYNRKLENSTLHSDWTNNQVDETLKKKKEKRYSELSDYKKISHKNNDTST